MALAGGSGRKLVSRLSALLGLSAVAWTSLFVQDARAQIGSERYSSIVVDAATGNVLEAANADAPRHPASLAKLMTLYMTFEALRDRRVSLQQVVPVSAYAAAAAPTKLGLVPGSTRLTVEDAILALVTKSANDAAAALGEMLGGSEDRFAQMMTLRARALGMNRTNFTNASGLPDPDAWTTARDLAILARHVLSDFPGFYPYFSTPSFTFQRRVIFNHDRMLQSYPGADGMKTGYTEASGHNLVTSAVRSGVRLIGVVLGAASNPERDAHMAVLLDQGFEQMDVPPEHRTAVANRLPSLIGTAHAATVTAQPIRPASHTRITAGWAIQVGSFANERAARDAAANARSAADGGEVRIEPASQRGRTVWRAQVIGLTAGEAQGACAALTRHRAACFVIRPDQRQVASR
jgi:D-alanyl-D-alanine carboxypeptidase